MANLMITKQCNLKCTYCFSNEFVNRQNDMMSYENFLKCLDFLMCDVNERIGIIGGEPTLHPNLKKMLVRLIDSPFSHVCLFTNGILLDRYFNELRNSKFQILINLNSPEMIGIKNFEHTFENANIMINELYMKEQVAFGLNVYSPDMNVGYIFDVLKELHQKKLRISVAVPNLDGDRNIDPLDYFKQMKPMLQKIVITLLEMDVAPWFDCNYIPTCILDDSDRDIASKYMSTLKRSNMMHTSPICQPVVDILPNLHVVRCFGMSDYYKVSLFDFKDISSLKRHFSAKIDGLAYQIFPSEKCGECMDYKAGNCSGGCYAYRSSKMKKAEAAIKQEIYG